MKTISERVLSRCKSVVDSLPEPGPVAQWQSRGLIIPWLQVRILSGPYFAPEAMEHVYVVRRYDLFDLAFPHGFLRYDDCSFEPRVAELVERVRKHGFFIERKRAENDSSYKQVIPYCVVLNGESVFLLKRFGKQGESRLHNKLSIGIGGHINPVDTECDILETGRVRELNEELLLEQTHTSKVVGIVNDESNPVGSVHFGIVYFVRVDKGHVSVREPELMEGAFKPWSEVRQMALSGDFNFETWSQLILERVELPRSLEVSEKIGCS